MKTKTTDFSADWRAATKEITDRIFDVQTFISATITFKAAIGPDDNQTGVCVNLVDVLAVMLNVFSFCIRLGQESD